MNILVTGSNGQLGRCLANVLEEEYPKTKHNYIFVDHNELDITSQVEVSDIVREHNIKAIINCAAYTNVDGAEEKMLDAMKVNQVGPGILANAMKGVGGFLIHISTNFVYSPFNGWDGGPFTVADAEKSSPLNIYGLSKRMGEIAVKESGCSYLILRTSWLYSGYGTNILTKLWDRICNMESHDDVLKYVCDQVSAPTNAFNLARNILRYCEEGEGSFAGQSIANYSDGGVASMYDFAYFAAELWGFPNKIQACYTRDFRSKAVRPKYAVMDLRCNIEAPTWEPIILDWRESLRGYLDRWRSILSDENSAEEQ